MRLDLRPATLAVLVVLALTGCSAGGSAATVPSGTARAAAARGSELASALDQVPDIRDGYVFYTDWSMLGDRNLTSAFSGLSNFAGQMKRDLGVSASDARWELQVQRVQRPPVEVLSYDDLSGLAAKLTRLGYHADGSILTAPQGQVSQKHPWMIPLRAIGIVPARHLLIGGWDAAAVRSLMTGPSHPLGRATSVAPLLAQATARQGRTVTAAIAVGSTACMPLTSIVRNAAPNQLAAVRHSLRGTFTPPQAQITAIAEPTGATALTALTFPDQRTAQANQPARTAAAATLSGLTGDAKEVRATGSTVTGRVLTVDLATTQPGAIRHRVMAGTLGVDLCP